MVNIEKYPSKVIEIKNRHFGNKANIKSLVKKKNAIPQATISNYSTLGDTRLKLFLRR